MFAVTASTKQETTSPLGAATSTSDRARTPAGPDAASAAMVNTPSAAGRLRLSAAELKDAATTLSQPDTWRSMRASPASTPAMAITAQPGAQGRFSIAVEQVATGQEVSSTAFTSLSTVVGIGTLDIQMGSWNGSMSTFATNPNWPKASVVLGPKDTTLDVIRDRINAAGVGVVATVVSDATGSRLVLRSTGTGAANGFRVEATPSPAADPATDPATAQALAQLSFNPASGQAGMALQQVASDAEIRIDDRSVQSPSNLISDQASGLDITVMARTDAPQEIAVVPQLDEVVRNVGNLVSRYNELMDTSAPQSDWMQALQARTTALAPQLAPMGVQADAAGRLSLDTPRLQAALLRTPQEAEQALGASGLAGAMLQSLPAMSEANEGNGSAPLLRQRVRQEYAPASNNASLDANSLPTGSVVSIEA